MFRLLDANADLTKDEVWIQGEEVSGTWRFHDGTAIGQHFCPLSETNKIDENHMRLRPSLNFSCSDREAHKRHNFVCEISITIRVQ
jgi:hypothetical protein